MSVEIENGILRQLSENVHGMSISFHNLCYTVQMRKGPVCFSSSTTKFILQNVNGIMKPGVNAIMGPTGSGKSSLLDILAGRKDPRFVSGHILVNGHKQPKNFKCMTGYVVQDDVVMGTLTVRENLYFSANLRLSRDYNSAIKKQKVSQVIAELGLDHCADTKVGTQLIRGVSGGERKRTNIGMELIVSPNVLFLDEPTTGLDASTANAVIRLLHALARKGRTIIFSIHQPRYSIYKLFDSMTLLHLGRVIYAGPSSDALHYFEGLGYVCEAHNNPPDFFLDVINGDIQADNAETNHQLLPTASNDNLDNSSANLGESRSQLVRSMSEEEEKENENKMSQHLANIYRQSQHYKNVVDEIEPILIDYQTRVNNGTEVPIKSVEYPTTFFFQLLIVSRRAFLNLLRNPQASVLQFIVMTVFGLIVGGIFFQLDTDLKGVGNRVGACFFLIMNMIFGNLSAVELFIAERVIFIHENSSGFYRVSAYFISKLFCDILPMRAIPGIVFSSVVYWMIGFRKSAFHFVIFMLGLISTSLCGSAVAFLYSASFSVFSIANLMVALTFVIMMVFSGLFINLTSLGEWISWLRYFSIFRYAFSLIAANELKDLKFCNTTSQPPICIAAGNVYLEDNGIKFETDWDIYQNFVALWSITTLLLTLCYVILRNINKYK